MNGQRSNLKFRLRPPMGRPWSHAYMAQPRSDMWQRQGLRRIREATNAWEGLVAHGMMHPKLWGVWGLIIDFSSSHLENLRKRDWSILSILRRKKSESGDVKLVGFGGYHWPATCGGAQWRTKLLEATNQWLRYHFENKNK